MRIGTRASALALAQTRTIADALAAAGHPDIEIVHLTTSGDREGNIDGGASSDKSRWVDTIEAALLAGEIDLAVHSAKDVPGELADRLTLLGSPPRADARDVLCGADSLASLPTGARVGTSSLRRAAQLRAVRDDLEVVALGGNIDTRLRRLADPAEGFGAIVLARAGLVRLGRTGLLDDESTNDSPSATANGGVGATDHAGKKSVVLDPTRFVPAPGQGTLALQARTEDSRAREAVAAILDANATACLWAERALARALGASCHTPLGAHATPADCGCLHLRGWVGLPDGSAWATDELVGGFYDPEALGARMAERMSSAGARDLLGQALRMADSGV